MHIRVCTYIYIWSLAINVVILYINNILHFYFYVRMENGHKTFIPEVPSFQCPDLFNNVLLQKMGLYLAKFSLTGLTLLQSDLLLNLLNLYILLYRS